MGTHPIFESDFDCLTVMKNDLTKREQLSYAGMTDKRDDLLIELNAACQRTFGLGVYSAKGTGEHVVMGQLDQTRAFLTKLSQKLPDPNKEQDHKLELLKIVLQVILFKQNALNREDLYKMFANFGTDGENERVRMSGATRERQKTPRQLVQHWEKYGWLVCSGQKRKIGVYSWGAKALLEFDPVDMIEETRVNLDDKGTSRESLYKAHFANTIEQMKGARQALLTSNDRCTAESEQMQN